MTNMTPALFPARRFGLHRFIGVLSAQLMALAALTCFFMAALSFTATAEVVHFESADGKSTTIRAYIMRPEGDGPFPAVVAMHGYGGLYNTRSHLKPRNIDWGVRLRKAGYIVLFPDSFGSRGHGNLCKIVKRPVSQSDRVADANGAARWLATRPDVDPRRLALMGWSNGGTSVLWTAASRARAGSADFRLAIAFYPWCRDLEGLTKNPSPGMPLTILIGGADDWTPPGPCAVLARRWDARILVYPGAYHDFDAPGMPMHRQTGTALSADGEGNVHAGTDPHARASAIVEVMKTLEERLASGSGVVIQEP